MTAAALRISYSPKILLHILCICSFTNRMCNKSTDGNNCTIMHHNILWISQIFYITFQLMKTILPSHPYAVHPHLLMLLLQNFFLIKHLILHITNVFAFLPQYFQRWNATRNCVTYLMPGTAWLSSNGLQFWVLYKWKFYLYNHTSCF